MNNNLSHVIMKSCLFQQIRTLFIYIVNSATSAVFSLLYSGNPRNGSCPLKNRGGHHTCCFGYWCTLYCNICRALSLSSGGNVQFGPCARPWAVVCVTF